MADFLIDKPGASFSLIIYLTRGTAAFYTGFQQFGRQRFFCVAANRKLVLNLAT